MDRLVQGVTKSQTRLSNFHLRYQLLHIHGAKNQKVEPTHFTRNSFLRGETLTHRVHTVSEALISHKPLVVVSSSRAAH